MWRFNNGVRTLTRPEQKLFLQGLECVYNDWSAGFPARAPLNDLSWKQQIVLIHEIIQALTGPDAPLAVDARHLGLIEQVFRELRSTLKARLASGRNWKTWTKQIASAFQEATGIGPENSATCRRTNQPAVPLAANKRADWPSVLAVLELNMIAPAIHAGLRKCKKIAVPDEAELFSRHYRVLRAFSVNRRLPPWFLPVLRLGQEAIAGDAEGVIGKIPQRDSMTFCPVNSITLTRLGLPGQKLVKDAGGKIIGSFSPLKADVNRLSRFFRPETMRVTRAPYQPQGLPEGSLLQVTGQLKLEDERPFTINVYSSPHPSLFRKMG